MVVLIRQFGQLVQHSYGVLQNRDRAGIDELRKSAALFPALKGWRKGRLIYIAQDSKGKLA